MIDQIHSRHKSAPDISMNPNRIMSYHNAY